MPETQQLADQLDNEYNVDGKSSVPLPRAQWVRTQLPAEPPQLSTEAARALLDLLLKAHAAQATADRSEET